VNRLILDSHLDLAWNALAWNRDLTEPIATLRQREAAMKDDDARGRSTVCLPELRRGNIAVCLGTILIRAKREVAPERGHRRIDLDVATQDIACAHGRGQLAYYKLLEARGEIRILTTRGELREHWTNWERANEESRQGLPVGVIIAMEGADPIVEPRQAEQWWRDGLRAVGLAHYGQSHYAFGTGGAGPLTGKGRELLREFERLGMILDLTHSSDPSFFEALNCFGGRVMASHNNCRVLVPHDRQYSDEQIRQLIERGAVIGAALDAWMLTPGYVPGKSSGRDVPLAIVVDHIDHICQIAGNTNHVGIGSDLDGGFGTEQSPREIETIADLQKLEPLLRERGYREADVDRIFHGNWLRFFSEALPP
jgi:membrane dipeptidase